jgi:hypothetical protein
MAQAALQEEFTFPAGGIADFYKDDEELAAMDREDAQRAFGNNGIANFQDVATRMASYGRYGDDKLVHAETGELIVPKALIEDNPKLRDSIFGHLRDMGIEDPERYVVGSRANSINPDTGLPEFFLKNLFKKVSKAVKKVSKKVVKLVKKAAPVIIPIALNTLFPGMGYIYQGALGAGIGTLVQGGSIKDAFKNALIGGAIGGATAGISGGLNAAPGQTFSQGAVSGIKDAARLSNLTTAGQQLASGQFGQAGFDAVTDAQNIADLGAVPDTAIAPSDTVSQATDFGAGQGPETLDFTGQKIEYPGAQNFSQVQEPGFFEKAGDYFFRGGQSSADIAATQSLKDSAAVSKKLAQYGYKTLAEAPLSVQNAAIAAGEAAASAAGPGFFTKFGPSAAAIGGATYLAGGFEAPEVEEPDLGPTGADKLRLTPYEYLIGQQNLRTRGSQGPTVVPTTYAAEGGEIFPRRVGGIMPNEGTPGKDSVRAMLMPGEFVMTTDAVKGLGNGDNDKGISNMYQMMRGLEAKGRAMA